MRRAALAVALALTLGGCGDVYIGSDKPESVLGALQCTTGKRLISGALVLIAQSVPSASAIPCLDHAPPDWIMQEFDVSDRRGRVVLGYEPQQDQRLTVDVVPLCDPAGGTEVPSGVAGVRRFDRAVRSGSSVADQRYYVYPDACTILRFQLSGAVSGPLAADIGEAFSFVTRDEIDRRVRELSGGRLHLDPGR